MKLQNSESFRKIVQEEIQSQRQMKLQTVEAWTAFAKLGPYDFRTGAEPIRSACSEALARLLPVALRDTGQSGVVARFLLGLYNGPRFPFDMTELRRLDQELFIDCVTVLMMDSLRETEVHEHFQDGGMLFEKLADFWVPSAPHDQPND